MTDREEREEHIKRLEAALACEEKRSSGKCAKDECDDNCALLYERGNWGEWKETLRYAINSLKTDLKYDLLYEETSGQADKQADKPTTKKDCNTCTHGNETDGSNCYECVKDMCNNYEPTTKNDLGVDAVSRKAVHDMLENLPITVEDKWFNWLQKACMRLAELTSVTPQEPRKGEWLRMSDLSEQEDDRYKCSRCGNVIHHKDKMNLYTFNSWCGRCGSDNGRHISYAVINESEELEQEPQKKRCVDCSHYGKLSLECGRCDYDCSMYEPRESEDKE